MARSKSIAPSGAVPYRMTISTPSGARAFKAPTVEALIEEYERWRDETGFGVSDIGARFPVDHAGVRVGHLSYNGKWWPEAAANGLEVPAVIAPSVPCVRLSEALARAGLVGAYDAHRGLLVIEPAVQDRARCLHCGGTGFEEDAACDFCAGRGRP